MKQTDYREYLISTGLYDNDDPVCDFLTIIDNLGLMAKNNDPDITEHAPAHFVNLVHVADIDPFFKQHLDCFLESWITYQPLYCYEMIDHNLVRETETLSHPQYYPIDNITDRMRDYLELKVSEAKDAIPDPHRLIQDSPTSDFLESPVKNLFETNYDEIFPTGIIPALAHNAGLSQN